MTDPVPSSLPTEPSRDKVRVGPAGAPRECLRTHRGKPGCSKSVCCVLVHGYMS